MMHGIKCKKTWFGKYKFIFSYVMSIDDMIVDHGVMFKIEQWLTNNAPYIIFREDPSSINGGGLIVSYTFILKKEEAIAFKMEFNDEY